MQTKEKNENFLSFLKEWKYFKKFINKLSFFLNYYKLFNKL